MGLTSPAPKAAAAANTAVAAEAQTVTIEGRRFQLGDTLGGLGPGMVAVVSHWKREGDTYTGVFYRLPDRGWNTERSIDYAGALRAT